MSDNRKTMLEWKEEPSSPNGGPSFLFEDEWLDFNDEPADINTKTTIQGENPSRAQIASELLDQLESGVEWRIKEEPFQDWLEEKIEIPIFEDLVPGEPVTLNNNCTSIPYPNVYKAEVTQPYRQYQLQPEQVQHHLQLQAKSQQLSLQQQLPESTQSLLQEFESILGDVEACHQSVASTSTLTPPQSPPPVGQILFALEPIQQQNVQYIQQVPIYGSKQYQLQQQQQQQLGNVVIPQRLQQQQQHQQQPQQQQPHQQQKQQHYYQSLQPDHDSTNVQIDLDNCIQLQNQWGAEKLSVDSLLIPSSPNDSCVSPTRQFDPPKINHLIGSYTEDAVPSSPFASSSENGSFEDSSEDPDWSSDGYSKATEYKKTSSSSNSSTSGNYRVSRKHRPYARPSPEDKRVRKKEQNKNAATRYRQKKKQEIKEILSEEQELVLRNEKLNAEVSDLQREIGYLKGLMRDLCKAKGLIK